MLKVDPPGKADNEKFLSILSKAPWCVDVLAEIARLGLCGRADLHRLLRRSNTQAPQDLEDGVDRYLTILEAARFVEKAGEKVRITPRGAAAVAAINATAATGHKQSPSQAAPIPKSVVSSDDGGQSSTHPTLTPENLGSAMRSLAQPEVPGRFRKYPMTFSIVAMVVASTLILLGWNYVSANTFGGSQHIFAKVERRDLQVFTLATGRIEAINAVEVSSQLSGQVVALDANFNDKVTAGAPLARLDDKSFDAAVAEARAQLAHAKASYDSAAARTAGAEARYEESRQAFERKQTLANRGSVSVQEIDQALARRATAKSERDASRADEAIQKAAIDMATAALRKAEIALERTVIRSPIDGIVIQRSVELGQTVAVSMEAPTLFTIARDLTEMRVHALVDEADIGQIRAGQKANFSVDAYPSRVFSGQVVEVHRAPRTVQNVVTYRVVITAQNPDLALLPGMTALVQIATIERPYALVVPNAALRFQPDVAAPPISSRETATEAAGQPAYVWVQDRFGDLFGVDISVGASDGAMTEVTSGSLSEGQAVAIGTRRGGSEKTFLGIRLGF